MLVKNRIDKLTESSRRLNRIKADGIRAVEREGAKVKVLIKILKDENSSRKAKERALRLLKIANKTHFGDLDIENGKIKGLTERWERYKKEILLVAKAKSAQRQIDELTTQIDELDKEAKEGATGIKKLGIAIFDAFSGGSGTGFFIKNRREEIKRLADIRDKIIEQKFDFDEALNPSGQRGGGGIGTTTTATTPSITAEPVIPKLDTTFIDAYAERLKEAQENAVTPLSRGFFQATDAANLLNEEFANLTFGNSIAAMNAQVEAANLLAIALQKIADVKNAANNAFQAGTEIAKNAAKEEGSAMKRLTGVVIGEIAKVIKARIQAAVAAQAEKVLASFPFPLNIALAAGAGAAAGFLIQSLIGQIGIPGLAQGGVIPAGYPNDTYPAFLSSGETVVPPGKLPNLGNGGGFIAEARIDLRELVIGIRREEGSLGRIE